MEVSKINSYAKSNFEIISGINPIYSLLKSNIGKRKIYEICILNSKQDNPKIKEILITLKNKKIPFRFLSEKDFEEILLDKHFKSQGIFAKVSNYTYYDLDLFLDKESTKNSKLVILDGITDVGNFGAIIRSAFAFDFDGIIIPKNRSVEVNKDTDRASAGTLEEMRIFRVPNLVQCIKMLKTKGFWIYGADVDEEQGAKSINNIDFVLPMAVILGCEHKGISKLVKENSDFLIKIDINENLDSLNVSVAAGIIFYEINKISKKSK